MVVSRVSINHVFHRGRRRLGSFKYLWCTTRVDFLEVVQADVILPKIRLQKSFCSCSHDACLD